MADQTPKPNPQAAELGIVATVIGEIVPYSFTNEDSGEQVGLVHLRIPGDVVSVNVDPKVAEKMQEGETWMVSGGVIVRKKSNRIHIATPTLFRRVKMRATSANPVIDFGNAA